MEDKVRRESKQYIEKLFRKLDKIGSGAIPKDDMRKLIKTVVNEGVDDAELDELLLVHAKRNKYTILNPKTKQVEIHYQDDTIDFPSCMAITIHFLAKLERRQSNAFAGQGLIRFSDLDRRPSVLADPSSSMKKRIF